MELLKSSAIKTINSCVQSCSFMSFRPHFSSVKIPIMSPSANVLTKQDV